MRRLLAMIVALLLAIATSSDLVACLDGCTEQSAETHGAPDAANACPLCHGWAGAPVVPNSPPAEVLVITEPLPTPQVFELYHPSIEHPPRRA